MSKRSLRVDQVEDTPVSRQREKLRCAWRGCWNVMRQDEPPICRAHLHIAHELYLKHGAEEMMEFRFSGPVGPQPAESSEPIKREPKEGFVYYVQIGAHVKIGWTGSLDSRMRDFPPNSQLLATHPGTRADEARMHRRFAADLTHGREWFVPSASLTHHINLMRQEHGTPDPVAFAAAPRKIPQPRPKSYVGGNRRGKGLIGEARTG